MSDEYIAGITGALLGSVIATAASYITAYWGPMKLEKEREDRAEERVWGHRKNMIKEMLDNAAPDQGRTLKTLKRVTGTNEDDLRRLLVELGARGFTRPDGEEAWIYKKDRPLGKYN